MPPQHTPASNRQLSVQPSAKNIFDREPLLIPQRPEDRPRQWYRRRTVVTSVLLLLAVAVVVGVGFGATVSRAFAGLATP